MSKTIRHRAYLAWIRTRPCVATGEQIGVEAAHVRAGNGGGMGLKPSDLRTLPLHSSEHRKQHSIGEKAYWENLGINPDAEIIKHLMMWIDDPKLIIAALEAAIVGCDNCHHKPGERGCTDTRPTEPSDA